MALPSRLVALVSPLDAQAYMQQSEVGYGNLSSSAPGRQDPNVLGGESAHRPDLDERGGFQRAQSSRGEGGTGSAVPSNRHVQNRQAHAAGPEKEAVAAVKPLLKPLYTQELLVRHQFKDAAKRAVHLLCEGSARDAHAAVRSALSSMGLELAASRVS